MAKRKRIHNIEKMIKEGYGSGIDKDYKPWIHTRCTFSWKSHKI